LETTIVGLEDDRADVAAVATDITRLIQRETSYETALAAPTTPKPLIREDDLRAPARSLLQVQHDAVVLHPGADRSRTLKASTLGERARVSKRSRKHLLHRLPIEQVRCGMGSVLQDLDDVGANSFLVGRILRRGIWILLPLDYGVRQQLTRRSA
jgi:hypothetical protein